MPYLAPLGVASTGGGSLHHTMRKHFGKYGQFYENRAPHHRQFIDDDTQVGVSYANILNNNWNRALGKVYDIYGGEHSMGDLNVGGSMGEISVPTVRDRQGRNVMADAGYEFMGDTGNQIEMIDYMNQPPEAYYYQK